MSIQDLEEAVELIEKIGGDFEGEKYSGLVDKAEKALGLMFPPSYKKFISVLGSGDIEGLEFFGLVGGDFDKSALPDAIWITLEERKSGLPNYLVLVYAAGNGSYCGIDTRQVDSNGESPIVSCGVGGNMRVIASDYGEFLLSELKTVLS